MNEKNKTGQRIVLVEDDKTLADLIVMELEGAGFSVLVEPDGLKGLALIRKEKPDLVLLDMMLPNMSGADIIEELHEDGTLPDQLIVILSNSGQPVETERAKELGVRDYLVKVNFSPQEVLEKVKFNLQEKEETEASAKTTDDKKGQKHILLVEDDPLLTEVLGRQFKDKSLKFSNVTNAEDAKKVLAEGPVHLILLDIKLPGMDGFVFLEQIKRMEAYKDIPVIIVSNLGQKEDIERGKSGGAVDYFIKANVFPEEIAAKALQILNNK